MPRGHRDRIADILAAIADIQADTQGMPLAAFEKKPVVVRSVLYSIGVIGEAVNPDFKAAHPDIPWRAIAGIRDRIVHEYFRTNTRRIWDVIQDDLGPLEVALQSAIGGGVHLIDFQREKVRSKNTSHPPVLSVHRSGKMKLRDGAAGS